MGLVLGGLNLRGGETRLPLPLGMLAQPLVDGVVPRTGRVGQARRRIAAEILLVGVPPRQQIPAQVRAGVQALLRIRGGGTPARTRGLAARALGAPSRDGEVQTHKPMDGTCDSWCDVRFHFTVLMVTIALSSTIEATWHS
jgi:hypothetical protein